MLRRFVARYGWRAYALPVLTVVTIVAVLNETSASGSGPKGAAGAAGRAPSAASSGSGTQSSGTDGSGTSPTRAPVTTPPTAASNAQVKTDEAGPGAIDTAVTGAALPAGPDYTMRGDGTFRVLPGSTDVYGDGPLYTYTIEVENGVSGVSLTAFAKKVDLVLADPRSWSGHGVSLQRVDSGTPDFRISLTSSLTVRDLCSYDIPVESSCWDAADGRVVLNVSRWVRGSAAYLGDLNQYRIYMINHEDGHALGHQHSHSCLPDGLAPVMMQQTFGLKTASGPTCQANPWPYPPGVAGTPGEEGPDTPQNDAYTLNE
ncbi:MAG: DUF3152 domain-containing protein [Actinomycetia bacterium]|nr:DUF3152 domain-containing protein [Actinomycetes bacterium]